MCTGTLYWVPTSPRTPKAAHGPPEDLSKKHGAATSARCKDMALTSAKPVSNSHGLSASFGAKVRQVFNLNLV